MALSDSVKGYIGNRMGYSGEEEPDELEDPTSPYVSIAREGAQVMDDQADDTGEETSSAAAAAPPVPAPAPSPGAPMPQSAALMGQYDASANNLAGLQQASRGANQIVNMGTALSGLSRGASEPLPQNPVYGQLAAQNQQYEKQGESDLARRASVIKAVQQAEAKKYGVDVNAKAKEGMLGAYKDRTAAIQGAQTNRQGNADIRTANMLLKSGPIQKEETKLNASNSAQALVDDIRSGKLKDSANIGRQLTNMIATIEMGSPGGVGDRQAIGVDTLYTRLKKMESFISGNPQSAIPRQYLDQLESEVHALGDRSAKNYASLTDAAIAKGDLSLGDPNADAGRVSKLAQQGREKFLSSKGYDPKTGERIKAAPVADDQDQQAIDWLKANPNDPAALGVKSKLQKKGLL